MEKIIPIYAGKPEDFHWAGFGSGSGTNLRECAKIIKPSLIFSDKTKAKLLSLEELSSAAKVVYDGYSFCGSYKNSRGNWIAEAEFEKKSLEFNKEIVNMLHDYEDATGKGIDLIVLGGYMRLIKEPLLEAYADKIINVHPSDLPANIRSDKRLDDKLQRLYIGDDAVYDALKFGQTETRSSVIMVDSGVDHGEILVQGPIVSVNETLLSKSNLREFADYHQDIQKEKSDWPALTTALKLISEGRLALGTEKSHHGEWRRVYLDGEKLPYNGLDLKK